MVDRVSCQDDANNSRVDVLNYANKDYRAVQKTKEEGRDMTERQEKKTGEDRVVQISKKRKQHCNMKAKTTWMQSDFNYV